MSAKTNAARILDGLNIIYELKEYKVDEEYLDAIHTAQKVGVDIKKVYKTIVCIADGEHIVACLQGDLNLDLKALAKVAGAKRCELINLKDITKITGYVRGGCSPLGMKKHFRTFLDIKAQLQEEICVSAGIRGKQIYLKPDDLIKATNAMLCDITQD